MNYSKHYNVLIERAKHRKISGYMENHHIIPKCVGGNNTKENIVSLTPEEHYVAHQLLIRIYPDNRKLIFSANMMCVRNNGQSRNNKRYGWLRKKMASALSKEAAGIRRSPATEFKKGKPPTGQPFKKGNLPWSKGKKNWLSEEHKEAIRESNRRCKKGLGLHRTDDQKATISKARIGKATGTSNGMNSAENRAKVGASKIGRKWFHNPKTKEIICVLPINKPDGFVPGKKVS